MIGDLPLPTNLLKLVTRNYNGKEYYIEQNDPIYGKTISGSDCRVETLQELIYTGNLEYGLFDGNGKLEFPDGTIYEGNFYKHLMAGKGSYAFPDANEYIGEVLGGKRHGDGFFSSKNGRFKYKGGWEKGTMHGKGVAIYRSGAQYIGEWKHGKRVGFGKIVYKSGNYYVGQWSNDNREGYGEMHWFEKDSESGKLIETELFIGFWKAGKQEGFGRHIWLEKKSAGDVKPSNSKANVNKQFINRYEGMFKNGKREGLGMFFYSNGSIYQGEWSMDKKYGFAIFTDMYGNTKEQIFKNDKAFRRIDEPRDYKLFTSVSGMKDSTHSKIKNLDQLGESIVQTSKKTGDLSHFRVSNATHKSTNSRNMLRTFTSKANSKNSKYSKNSRKYQLLKEEEQRIAQEKLKKEQQQNEFKARNRINTVSNPYSKLLNLEKMLMLTTNCLQNTIISKPMSLNYVKHIKGQIEKVLMRNHLTLQKVFSRFKIRQGQQDFKELKKFLKKSFENREEILKREKVEKLTESMRMDSLFKMLLQAHVLNPELSRASFQRLFFADERNQVPSHFDFYILRDRIRELKLKTYYDDYEQFQSSYSDQQFVVNNLPLNAGSLSKSELVPILNIQNQTQTQNGENENKNSSSTVTRAPAPEKVGTTRTTGRSPVIEAVSSKGRRSSRVIERNSLIGVGDNTLGIGLNQINEAEEIEEDSLSKKKSILSSVQEHFASNMSNLTPKYISGKGLVKNLSEISENENSAHSQQSQDNILAAENTKLLNQMKIKDQHFSNFFVKISLSHLHYSQTKVANLDQFYESLDQVEHELQHQLKRSREELVYDANCKILDKLYKNKKKYAFNQNKNSFGNSGEENQSLLANIKTVESKNINVEGFKMEITPFNHQPEFDIHDGQNVVLYRNFVDALTRIIHFRECVQACNDSTIPNLLKNQSELLGTEMNHKQFYHYLQKLNDFPKILESYLKFRIEPLLERQLKSEFIFGGKNIQKIHSMSNLQEEQDSSHELPRYPVSTRYVDETMQLEDQFTESKYSLNGFTPKLGKFKTKSLFKLLNSGEKFVRRVFFSKYSNLRTATGKIKTQLDECYSIFAQVYEQLQRVRYFKSGGNKYAKKDTCQYQEYKSINVKSLIRYLRELGFIKHIDSNLNILSPADMVYSDEDIVIQIVERYLDPDSTYSFAKFNYLFRIPYLQTQKNNKLLLNSGEESSFTVSSHHKDLKNAIEEESLLGVSDDANLDRIAIVDHRRQENNELVLEQGLKPVPGLKLKDLKKRSAKGTKKQSQIGSSYVQYKNQKRRKLSSKEIEQKNEIKEIMKLDGKADPLAQTDTYRGNKNQVITSNKDKTNGPKNSSHLQKIENSNSGSQQAQYEITQKARSIGDLLQVDPLLMNFNSHSMSLEQQKSPKFVENMIQRQKDLMSDFNYETLTVEQLASRMEKHQIELSQAKIRTLEMELTFNEFVETFMLYCFTQGILLENQTSPEDLLSTVQKLKLPSHSREQNQGNKGIKISKKRTFPMSKSELKTHKIEIRNKFNQKYTEMAKKANWRAENRGLMALDIDVAKIEENKPKLLVSPRGKNKKKQRQNKKGRRQ